MAYINKIVVNGQEVNANQLEGILDKDGHARFIEGEITTPTITGFTFTYAKWSLSGTHLMIVLAGAGTSTIALSDFSVSITNIPSWVMSKLVPAGTLLTLAKATGRESGTRFLNETFSLTKPYSDELKVMNEEAITVSNNFTFRIQFDMLVDNA